MTPGMRVAVIVALAIVAGMVAHIFILPGIEVPGVFYGRR